MALTKTPVCDFGKKAEDFKLKSIDNKVISLNDIKGDKATLIMFICNHCPYVKAIIKDLATDCNELKKDGINSVAIMSNDTKNYPEDSFDNMIKFADNNNFGTINYLFDETQKTSWVDYLQDSINKINSNQLDYLLHEEYGFTKEKSIRTLKYLISKYRCNIYSFEDDKLGYNIASFPNYDYEKHLEGTTILSVVKTILGFPMTLIRKLILKRKWRKQ